MRVRWWVIIDGKVCQGWKTYALHCKRMDNTSQLHCQWYPFENKNKFSSQHFESALKFQQSMIITKNLSDSASYNGISNYFIYFDIERIYEHKPLTQLMVWSKTPRAVLLVILHVRCCDMIRSCRLRCICGFMSQQLPGLAFFSFCVTLCQCWTLFYF
mgnify:FL=1